MFFLERKEQYVLPNILGNRSFPVYTYRWKAAAKCEEREPLEEMMKGKDAETHRIVSNLA